MSDRALVQATLHRAELAFDVTSAGDAESFRSAVQTRKFDLILSDYNLLGFRGDTILAETRAAGQDCPFIFVSGALGEETAIDLLKLGATDYVLKSRLDRLIPSIDRALEESRLRQSTLRAQQEARAALARVTESEARFRNMADHAPVILRVTDERGSCTYLSKGWYDLTGRVEAASLHWGWLNNIHEQDLARVRRDLGNAHEARHRYRMNYRVCRHDGAYCWVIDSGVPRFEEEAGFVGFISSMVDITEQKEVEIALQESEARYREAAEREKVARQQAEEANRLKDQFLATVSHELRTPLTSILGWIHMLQFGTIPEEQQLEALQTIERNARAQARIVDDLLDVSRILASKLSLETTDIDLATVVEHTMASIRPAATAKGIHLTHTATKPAPVCGDPQRLEQVVWNLVTNAVKFTPTGGTVSVELQITGVNVELSVRDTGQGISEQFLPHVFEAFRQADGSTTRLQGGLGLGLAIVKQLVELHGGSVQASSPGAGQGAVFCVRLPLVNGVTTQAEATPEPKELEGDCPPDLVDLSVLVVDDEQDVRDLVQAILEGCGASVLVAASADAAYQLFVENKPDLLISDIGMPAEDGYSFVSRIRRLNSDQGGDTPAVAVTAYSREEDRARAEEAGFSAFLTKPFGPRELLKVLARLLGDSRE